MCRCLECGHLFEPDEAFMYTDILDYIDGIPYKETYPVCPVCCGQFEEIERSDADDEP